jgi:trimethylamine---corrinoid protein Co-methyltransferase
METVGKEDASAGFVRTFKPIDVLPQAEVEAVHVGALKILEITGANVRHAQALELLAANGCLVDDENQMARIPAALAEECLKSCPSSYRLVARESARSVDIGDDRVVFLQGMGMRFLDLETWERRPATLGEHVAVQIVGDALPNMHIGDALYTYTDIVGVPAIMQQLECLANGFRYSSKPQHYGYLKDSDRFAIAMAQELGVNLDAEIDIAPPIAFTPDAVDALMRFAQLGWGLWASPGAFAGATSPASLAGTAVEAWAATIAFIVIAQLVRPGTPVTLCPSIGVVHPKSAHPLMGAPETWFTRAMCTQVARMWQIPITTGAGFCGEAKMIDYQNAYEKALGVLFSVLTGDHLHILHGSFNTELAFSNELQVLDDDIAGMVGRLLQGAEVSEETLAIDLINKVGTAPASFMHEAHTRSYWIRDRFWPLAAERSTYSEWAGGGKPDVLTLAKAKIDEILATHTPEPLPQHQSEAIDSILAEARGHYRKTGVISSDEWSIYMQTLQATGRM